MQRVHRCTMSNPSFQDLPESSSTPVRDTYPRTASQHLATTAGPTFPLSDRNTNSNTSLLQSWSSLENFDLSKDLHIPILTHKNPLDVESWFTHQKRKEWEFLLQQKAKHIPNLWKELLLIGIQDGTYLRNIFLRL
eukprot:Gregarina_sp_Poly_1__5436@NODE_2870_length_1612_cov_43_855016_g1650_i1_p2_GENE_NODE_2870_length_1612_cov_43_855016_g1650_i1NODE_2870_length_1612_cov_43_855016_g1650_i1_p2_ORF_typecomplete_len136_score1_91Exostosin/PF03016_15/0_02TetR_C_17/PF17922_1/0_3_NODE_2870_length_1612_cov_43_855016_g1650_i17031110